MKGIVHEITGRAVAEINGERRVLACDMSAAEVLYESQGELWTYWLVDRCAGHVADIGGVPTRVVLGISRDELGLLLYALLAGDRRKTGKLESIEELLGAVEDSGLSSVQQFLTRVVAPNFHLPGKGLAKDTLRRLKKKREAWHWKRTLETAFGVLNVQPETFWSLTLVEWHALLAGHAEQQRIEMRRFAWLAGYILVAAGVKPEKVTVAKLLGEKEPRSRKKDKLDIAPEDFDRAWNRGSEVGPASPADEAVGGVS